MITSGSNRQMKNILLLQKKGRARREQGLFVVEGRKMFAEAPREWLSAVYVSEDFLTQPKAEELLAGISYEVVSAGVFQTISDTQTPQGILCVVRQPVYELSGLLKGKNPHLLVLESIQDPGNLGTMLRTGEGAGITGMIVNQTTADLFSPKTVRATMGSIYRVPYYVSEDLAETVTQLKCEGVHVYAAHLKGEMQYDEPDYTGGTAFLIGNEGAGLSDGLSALADDYIRIPMEGRVESLNAAVSASLLMYETNRQRRKSREE